MHHNDRSLRQYAIRSTNVDERFDGYRAELLKVIDELLRLEQQRPHNVAQQVQRRISALGELLAQKQGAKS